MQHHGIVAERRKLDPLNRRYHRSHVIAFADQAARQHEQGEGRIDVRHPVVAAFIDEYDVVAELHHQLRKPTPRLSNHNASALRTATKPSISA